MNLHLTSISIILLAISCRTKTKEWQTLDFGPFKLKTPQGWSKIERQGIDSYYGGLANGKDTLWFDYGPYSVNLSGEETYVYRYAKDTVNGLNATIMIPDTAGKGYISMYIPGAKDRDKFTIWGANHTGTDTILKIYKSILFRNSDTSQNPPLTFSKFIYKAHGDGKTLFYTNCASCHSIHKNIIGPALSEVIPKRTGEWIYQFLTDREIAKNDSAYQALTAKNEPHCMEFPHLTKDDVELIIDYIKAQ
jgi:hypothetical protein